MNDDVCDCPGTCADEEKWNCDTCMCPEVCGNRHRNCFDVFFQCPGTNCTISVFSLNDRHCDCPDCSDEEDWTCETCLAGCPTTKTCQSLWVYACESAGFACIFGSSECIFPWSAVNDNFCNCPFCEDEDAWDCSNCSSGCTGELCDFVLGNGLDYNRKNERGYTWQRRTNCFGEQLTPPDYSVQCPGYPANSGFPATQPGCTIPFTALNDNRCDCPTCRDESNEACGDGICSSSIFCSPGGVNSLVCPCPTSCGAPADCTGKCYGDPLLFGSGPPNFYPVEVPVGKGLLDCLYYCPGAECAKTVYILNDSVCDCINCEDEGSFSCETCTCPAAPLQRVEDFNSVGCGFTPVDAVLQGKGPLDGLPPWLGFRPTCVSLSPDGDVIFGAKAGGVHGSGGSFKQNLLQRAAPRVDLELNKVVHQALADEGVRKAVKSAEAEGYSAASLKAEMDALGSAIGFGPHHRRVYGLVHSFLAERDVQKTLENWVAEAYSEQAEDDVRQLVLKKAMTPRPPMWGSPILLHPPVRPSAAGALPAWPRRLQPPSYFANFPFLPQSNGFRGRGSVPCPGSDCFISFLQLNDRICDCPGCTDEDAFECDSCVPKVPFGPTVAATQSNLGVAVGVSLGVAVGVGLGVGLGVSAALGGVFSAVGVVQFTVANAQDFINNPQVQQGLKKAFLRLAGLAIAESAVTLNWACAGDALAQINSKLRRLAEAVRLCFEIEIEGEEKSLDACEDLASTSSGTARRVINEELQNAAAASGSVQVVQWSANPNPLSKDPTRVAPSKTFAAPKAVAFDPGNLPPGLSTGPAAPAEPPPVKR